MATSRARRAVGVVAAVVLVVAWLAGWAAGPAGAGPAVAAPNRASGTDPTVAFARTVLARHPELGARLDVNPPTEHPAGDGVSAATATVSTRAIADPLGDVDNDDDFNDEYGDLTALGARYTGQNLRLTATTPNTFGPPWEGETGLFFSIDAGGTGTVDFLGVIVGSTRGRFISAVVTNTANPRVLCAGNATIDPGARFSMIVPASCIGSPARVALAVELDYDDVPGTQVNTDRVPNQGLMAPVAPGTSAPAAAGAYVVDPYGGLHVAIAGTWPPALTDQPGFASPIARGVAMTPDAGHGFVLDGFGRLYGFGVGLNDTPPVVRGLARWPGWDIARGVAILPDGGHGLVIDGFGGLHPFGVGASRPAPQLYPGPYWAGWDIVRGIAVLPNGQGGFVLDGYGGLHWFSIGARRAAPAVFGGPNFSGWDIARGVAILPNGLGGFVIDAGGGYHWFSIGAPRGAPPMSRAEQWYEGDVPQGLVILPRLTPLPPPPPSPVVKIPGEITDVVLDASGRLAYATNHDRDSVVVVDVRARKLVATIPVGKQPSGLDLTPDGTKLYVANSREPSISVVDVATRRQIRKINVPVGNPSLKDWPFSIAILTNGRALFTTTFPGSGNGGRLMQLDLATDALMQREDGGQQGTVSTYERVKPSGNRTKATFTGPVNSCCDLSLYDTATDTFAIRSVGVPYIELNAVPNRDGSRILVAGRYVFDNTLNLLGTIEGPGQPFGPTGGALAASGAVGYRTTDQMLQPFDMTTFVVSDSLDLGDTTDYLLSGRVVLTPDGSRAVVTTDHGLSIVAL